MDAPSGGSSSLSSLPPPRPKSPPAYPDLYGKRREMAKVQMLEREIGFLEEELKSIQSLQPASRCCKEIADYVVAHSDPFTPTNRKNHRRCRFWKWLCGFPCFNTSWICCCCCSGCSLHLEIPCCCRDCNPCSCNPCSCNPCNCNPCSCNPCSCNPGSCNLSSCNPFSCGSSIPCHLPKWRCCACPQLPSCKRVSCGRNCCNFPNPSCPDCSCCVWKCSCLKCPEVCPCCCCTRTCCCNPCNLCC